MREIHVGVIFPQKKVGHLHGVLESTVDSVLFTFIDLYDKSIQTPKDILEKYGTIDVILHKLAHEMVFARNGDVNARKRVELMKSFEKTFPSIPIIDSFKSVEILTNRKSVLELVGNLALHENGVALRVPKFCVALRAVDIRVKVQENELALPLIVKSIDACATEASHKMQLITSLCDIKESNEERIVQEFVNHNGRLYKGYVLGDAIHIALRPSLSNVSSHTKGMMFDTQCAYPNMDSQTFTNDISDTVRSDIERIGRAIQKEVGVTLFGFDVIVEEGSDGYIVIDVNYFPSYKEFEDFGGKLRKHMRNVVGR